MAKTEQESYDWLEDPFGETKDPAEKSRFMGCAAVLLVVLVLVIVAVFALGYGVLALVGSW